MEARLANTRPRPSKVLPDSRTTRGPNRSNIIPQPKAATPIVEMFVAEKKVRVVGAIYNLEDGRIKLLG